MNENNKSTSSNKSPLIDENSSVGSDSHNKKGNFVHKLEKIFLNIDEEERARLQPKQPTYIDGEKSLLEKKRSAIKAYLELNKMSDKKELEELQKAFKTKSLKKRPLQDHFKVLFNINSHFVLIWKTIFALFNVVIVFLFFFKYFFLSILKQTNPQIPINIHICYTIINLTFAFEFLLSIAIIIFNGGSLFTYIKLPLKFIMILPIPLHPDCGYRWLIIFKFARIDLVERLFTIVETICNKAINRFLHNFYIKVFMTYINVLFKYLLIFGLYAHFIGSVFAYYSNNAGYLRSVYYTLETFTTIGYGDVAPEPEKIETFLIIILNMFIGVNLFYIITTNIKLLYLKIYQFTRDTSFEKQLENLIFKFQKSSGIVFPRDTKNSMVTYLIKRRGLCFNDLLQKYEDVFKMVRHDVRIEIREKLFQSLLKKYEVFFEGCKKDFKYEIFENLRPKIYEPNKQVISYGESVNKMYFLFEGVFHVYNYEQKIIYGFNEATIVGDWEFLNNLVSDVTVKAFGEDTYGFVLNKDVWERIIRNDPQSFRCFYMNAFRKKQIQNEWLYGNKYLYKEMIFDNSEGDNKLILKGVGEGDEGNIIENENEISRFDNDNNEENVDESVINKKIEMLKKNVSNLEFGLINLKQTLLEKL
jgi:hypothetical protein